MAIGTDCDPDCTCLPCKLAYWRAPGNGLNVDPRAMPTRRNHNPTNYAGNNSWERGIPTDNRGMPQLRPDGEPMRVKEFAQKRSLIDEARRQRHQSVTPTTT